MKILRRAIKRKSLGPLAMEEVLELLERCSGRLSSLLRAEDLARLSLAAPRWRSLEASEAWESLAQWRFGATAVGGRAWGKRLLEEEETMRRWETGALKCEKVVAFSSFVRCWVSDDQLLVAGLYNGTLQAVSWDTGEKVPAELQESIGKWH